MIINKLKAELARLANGPYHVGIAVRSEFGNFEINGTESFKAASLMKLFILGEYFRKTDKGELDSRETVHMKDYPSVRGAGVISFLSDPPALTLQQLAELMIIVSDNTASNILLERMGFDSINRFIKEIGLKNTLLKRKFMDDTAPSKGLENMTTAEDVTRLLQLFASPNEFFQEKSRLEIMRILGDQQFNDKLPKWINKAQGLRIHHKTGELPCIEHDAAILSNNGRMAIITVLTKGDGTKGEAQQLIAEAGHVMAELLF